MTVYIYKNILSKDKNFKAFKEHFENTNPEVLIHSLFDTEDDYPILSYNFIYNCFEAYSEVHRRWYSFEVNTVEEFYTACGFVAKAIQPKKKRKKDVKNPKRKVTKVLVLYGDETEYTIKNPERITVEEEYTTIVTAEEVDGDFEDVVKTTSIKIRNSSLDKIVITTPRFASMVCYNRENYEHGSTVVIENGSMKFVNHVEYYNLTLEE